MVTLLVYLDYLLHLNGNITCCTRHHPLLVATGRIHENNLYINKITPEKKEKKGESVITCDAMATKEDTLYVDKIA